jgi:hypothetical protein
MNMPINLLLIFMLCIMFHLYVSELLVGWLLACLLACSVGWSVGQSVSQPKLTESSEI